MGNNNATANLTEEESSKQTNGMSPLESVPIGTTQDQVFLAGDGKDGDKEKENFTDGVTESPEREPQREELVEDLKVKNVEEEMHISHLESSVMEIDEKLQKQTSVAKGVETVCEATEVEELSLIGTQSVVRKLNTTEFGNDEKPCVIDEIVFVSPSSNETVGTEADMINESLEEIVLAEEVVKLDQEIGMEQRTGFLGIEPQEILNLDYSVLDDDEVITNERQADQEISKLDPEESNAILEIGFEVYEEERRGMELEREASLKHMSRCRSLSVSQNTRVMEGSLVQTLVSEIVFPSTNMPETLHVSCVRSNKAQETTEEITKSNKEAIIELRSPTFGSDLRIKERSDESTEKIPILCQDVTETYEAIIDVEEKTVMLKRTETEKARGFELSLGLSMKPSRRSKADDSFKETKGLGDSFEDKKANTYDNLLVSCVGSNNPQETAEVITEGNKEARLQMRSPRNEEISDKSMKKTAVLCQEKTETYEAPIDVEKKSVMLKTSVSEKSRGFELSLGLSMKPSESSEAEGSFKETKDSGDNLLDNKASWDSMKGRVRKRSKSSLFGTCLCCAVAMN